MVLAYVTRPHRGLVPPQVDYSTFTSTPEAICSWVVDFSIAKGLKMQPMFPLYQPLTCSPDSRSKQGSWKVLYLSCLRCSGSCRTGLLGVGTKVVAGFFLQQARATPDTTGHLKLLKLLFSKMFLCFTKSKTFSSIYFSP